MSRDRTESILLFFWKNFDFILCFLFFLLILHMFYPGLMSPDSVSQLRDAITGNFSDWHPPVMSATWKLTNKFVFGPFGMLIFHNLMFSLSLSLFIRYVTKKVWLRCLYMLIIGFMPSIFSQLGVIWKDVGFSASLFLASSILLFSLKKPWFAVLSLPPLFYGAAVRYNSWLAIFPICIWIAEACPAVWLSKYKRFEIFLIGTVVFCGLLVSVCVMNAILVKGKNSKVEQIVPLVDLAGMTAVRKEMLIPIPFLEKQDLTAKDISDVCFPANCGFSSLDNDYHFIDCNAAYNRELFRVWLNSIIRYPKSYLKCRALYFARLLGIAKRVFYPYRIGMADNPFGFNFVPGRLSRLFYRGISKISNSIIFRGWFYMVLGLLVFASSIVYENRPAFFVSASGLF